MISIQEKINRLFTEAGIVSGFANRATAEDARGAIQKADEAKAQFEEARSHHAPLNEKERGFLDKTLEKYPTAGVIEDRDTGTIAQNLRAKKTARQNEAFYGESSLAYESANFRQRQNQRARIASVKRDLAERGKSMYQQKQDFTSLRNSFDADSIGKRLDTVIENLNNFGKKG